MGVTFIYTQEKLSFSTCIIYFYTRLGPTFPNFDTFSDKYSIIRPTAVVRNTGVMFDNVLSLKSQVSQLRQVAFFYIRRTRSIRDCLTQHATELFMHSLVIYRLDYGNCLLFGVSEQLLDKLQESRMWQRALLPRPVAMTTYHRS